MASMNKAILIGKVAKDLDIRQSQAGADYCRLSLATADKWNGEERTEYHAVLIFGKLAEVAIKYLAKDRQVCIEGRIQYRKWTDKAGVDRWITEIIASALTLLGGGTGKGGNGGQPKPSEPPVAFVNTGGELSRITLPLAGACLSPCGRPTSPPAP
ncbi:MAG: single-stranded DNA-binding protein [Candidatus Adiutrix sp.]|nr:single-stranded DNA-binding protein [Candidatus Adiutrix sp.]